MKYPDVSRFVVREWTVGQYPESAAVAAVHDDHLQPEALRRRFASPPAWEAENMQERWLDREPSAASVLVPLVVGQGGLSVMLTQRTDHLHDHAGQISFPGGRAEAHDEDVVATALREAREETGLPEHTVEVLGALPIYITATNFHVTPVVALVHPPFDIKADPFEVAEVFEVPLAFLMNPANHQKQEVETPKGLRHFYTMPYPTVDDHRYYIWGATAGMLRNLFHFLRA